MAETCQGLIDHLVHRYRFEGSGNSIIDSIAGANGTSTTSLTGCGTHFWSGGPSGSAPSGAYANWDTNEPDNSSSTKDCSFMYNSNRTWWAWDCTGWGGNAVCEWRGHRSSSIDRGVWFTLSNGSNRPTLSYRATSTTTVAAGTNSFSAGTETHVAMVLDPVGVTVALYIDGVFANSATTSAALSGLRDGDNWLGRSHLTADPSLNASMSELRIYNTALSAPELDASFQAGPDPSFLP